MPQTSVSAKSDHPVERPGGVRGPALLLLTLGIVVAVPLITVLSLRVAERDLDAPPPLDWDQRASWDLIAPQPKAIERGMMSSARTNQTYFEFDSPVTPDQEQAMWQAAQIAARPPAELASPQPLAQLRKLVSDYPDLFYPRFLLAQLTGDPAMLRQAIAAAPRCMVLPVVDAQANPLRNVSAGSLEVALLRIKEDQVDESLVLRYPLLRTDELGRAYLPVYEGIYRLGDAAPAAGIEPSSLLQGYFAFPGRTAVLPRWVATDAQNP